MKLAGAPPRPPRPFRRNPLVEFLTPERGDPRTFLGRQRRRLVGRADQYSQQKVGRLAVQTGDRNQSAEVDQVMDPKPLLMRVFAHVDRLPSPRQHRPQHPAHAGLRNWPEVTRVPATRIVETEQPDLTWSDAAHAPRHVIKPALRAVAHRRPAVR